MMRASGTAPADPGAGQNVQNHVVWGSVCTTASFRDGRKTIILQDVTSSECSSSSIGGKQQSDNSALEQSDSDNQDAGEKVSAGKKMSSNILPAAQQALGETGLWSVGSQDHPGGLCKPCQWVHTSKGCRTGKDCSFCHLPHNPSPDEASSRPCKARREHGKKVLKALGDAAGDVDAAQFKQMVKDVTCQSTWMQSVAHKHLKIGKSRLEHQVQGDEDVQAQRPKSVGGSKSSASDVMPKQDSNAEGSGGKKMPRRRCLVSL